MRVLLFSNFALPDSCADATRVMSFTKLLQQLGHETELLGVAYGDIPLTGSYDGIGFEMLRAKNWTGIRAYKRIAQLKQDIAAYLQQKPKYDAILLSNIYYDFADVFLAYARKTGARLMVNEVEWLEKDNIQFQGLKGKINFIKNRIALRSIHVKMGNIIAISSLLDDYYKDRGCNTVTIPTIVDTKEYEVVSTASKPCDGTVKIAYAGTPGKKDYIANAIRAVALLSEDERKRLQLHLYGPEPEQLSVLGLDAAFLENYKENIVCHGRIPFEQVKHRIAEADFTVLLRPNKRYANAGFPTKVGESMACGTPVIANLTSDLHKYIIDGQTGIVCADETPESCAKAFRKALSMTDEQRQAMHDNCLKMAKEAFDYRAYVGAMEEILKK